MIGGGAVGDAAGLPVYAVGVSVGVETGTKVFQMVEL